MHDGAWGKGCGRANCGAVAPTVALTLTALIAVGGMAFDYSQGGESRYGIAGCRRPGGAGGGQPARPDETMKLDSLAPPQPHNRCSPTER